MAIATLKARKLLTEELEHRCELSEPQIDSDVRLRHVWRKGPDGRDWMFLCSSRHFDFRKNIIEDIVPKDNSGHAVLCGKKNGKWYVYKTDLIPLISEVLDKKIRTANKKDGSTYYEVDYQITDSGELRLTAYPCIDFVEMSELSESINDC